MRPESVVCWKWQKHSQGRTTFTSEHVNVLRAMVARHFCHPHRFICVTDDSDDIDPRVEVLPDWNDFPDLRSPHGGKNPSCYRRLRMYHPDAAQWFGKRSVSLDLDSVVVGDLIPLWDRPEEFVIWGDRTNPKTPFNGSMQMVTAGTRSAAWTEFNPKTSPHQAMNAGHHGSDQAWLSYLFKGNAGTWTKADGVYSYSVHIKRVTTRLPDNARIVFFHGDDGREGGGKPWTLGMSQKYPWIGQHYVGERMAVAS